MSQVSLNLFMAQWRGYVTRVLLFGVISVLKLDWKTVFLHIQVCWSSQTKGLEWGWKQRARQGRDAKSTPNGRVRLALCTHKTLTPRFTHFFTDLEKKNDCFAVYAKVINYCLCLDTKCSCRVMEMISNKFHWRALNVIIFGDFCWHSIKTRNSWPNFFKFQSMPIHSNRWQETILILCLEWQKCNIIFGIQLMQRSFRF